MSVTAPLGFRAAGVSVGELDLALLVNDGPDTHAAGVFTSNENPAAPVLWSRQVLTTGRLRAVVLNSGCANAGTGPTGFQTAHAVAEQVAQALDCGAIEVAVCSTGPVGDQLPRDAVLGGVRAAATHLVGTDEAGTAAASAGSTRSVKPAEARYRDSGGWSVGGTAAASDSILLCVLTTDAEVEAAVLEAVLPDVAPMVFEGLGTRFGAEGGSANDTVLLLCSGASGRSADRPGLAGALATVGAELAGQLRVTNREPRGADLR